MKFNLEELAEDVGSMPLCRKTAKLRTRLNHNASLIYAAGVTQWKYNSRNSSSDSPVLFEEIASSS